MKENDGLRRLLDIIPRATGLLPLACLLVPLGVLGSGCGEDDEIVAPAVESAEGEAAPDDGAATTTRRKRGKKKKNADTDILEVPDDEELAYTFNPVGKRDPFVPFLKTKSDKDDRIVTPLQKYDLSQYKLVGIIWGESESTAMVEDPEKNGHFIRVGTLIGKNWGKVARINPNNVVVAEEYRDFQGRLVVNEIVMELPQL